MPTIFTHAAIPLAAGLGLGRSVVSRRLLAAGMLASMLPDFDVLAFRLGIAYADAFGHRGASHSSLFAAVLGLLALVAAPWLRSTRPKAFAFVALSAVSHPLLDMLTNGGLGVALFWPWSDVRYFLPWHVVQVSPIGRRFLSERGLAVLASEFFWIWLPAIVAGLSLLFARRAASLRRAG